MTWTYDPSQLAGNPTMQVRLTIGDTFASDPQLQDEEISFFLSQRGSIWGAAAEACRAIAANTSRLADTVQGEFKQNYSNRARAYAARAATFEGFAISRGGAMPYAGGISVADKQQQELDADRVPPQFNIGMDDNQLPVAPAGNESDSTPPAPGLE